MESARSLIRIGILCANAMQIMQVRTAQENEKNREKN